MNIWANRRGRRIGPSIVADFVGNLLRGKELSAPRFQPMFVTRKRNGACQTITVGVRVYRCGYGGLSGASEWKRGGELERVSDR